MSSRTKKSTVPIIFENEYKLRAELDFDVDRLVEQFKKHSIQLDSRKYVNNSVTKNCDLDIEFSSFKNLDEIRSVLSEIEDGEMMVKTVNYADEYVETRPVDPVEEEKKESSRVQCHYCRDLYPAKIHPNEDLPCCDACLCVCSEYTHSGADAKPEDMEVHNVGGTHFRVCKGCSDIFMS